MNTSTTTGRKEQRRREDRNQQSIPTTIVKEEDDLDARPVMLRVGKLHATKELPNWFVTLDTDKDGQVALWEWRRAGKNLDDFRDWDRNDDGYITPEEAIYRQHLSPHRSPPLNRQSARLAIRSPRG